jgi:2-iminoacetate synthase ThiH
LSLPASHTLLASREAEAIVREAVEAGRMDRAPAERLALSLADENVCQAAREGALESKLRGKGDVVTVSRNIFLPLTNLCRDRCAYCTFAKLPDSPEAHTYTLDEVEQEVREGVRVGAIEALFCLGDKPEIAYRSHRQKLARWGYTSTSELLVEACRVAFERGMLPHTNAGILSQDEMARLRPWNASMGLMLETTSQRLRGKGMAHYYAPDKEPATRIRMHEEAGELAAHDPRSGGEARAHPRGDRAALPSQARHPHARRPGPRRCGGRGLGRDGATHPRAAHERAGAAEPGAAGPGAAGALRAQ